MIKKLLLGATLLGAFAIGGEVNAGGVGQTRHHVYGGALTGAAGGAIVGGPVGAVVGAGVGAVAGANIHRHRHHRSHRHVVHR